MADYYPLIARAVANLPQNTESVRRAIYERARDAFAKYLRGPAPTLSQAQATRERESLEEAIRRVETEAQGASEKVRFWNRLFEPGATKSQVLPKTVAPETVAPKPSATSPPREDKRHTSANARSLVEKLTDDQDASARLAALEKVSDQAAIAGAARFDKDTAVRTAAVKKVQGDPILAELLGAERDAGIRAIILDKIKDYAVLGKVAQQHSVPEVRAAASKRLAEVLRATIMLGDSAMAISLLGIPGDHHLDPDKDGWTPLHCAALKGDLEVAKLLLAKGAPPDARDNTNKWTALHYAASHGHARLVAALIKAGADPNAVSGPDRNTPLHLAAAGLPNEFSASLRTKPDIPSEAAFRKQSQSHPAVASELLKHGADPHRACRQGYLPLQVAAERGDITYGQALLAGGADLNKRGAQDSTALHWAAAKKQAAFGKWLVENGAAPDLADALGWTPLFLADANGTAELVPVLLAAGAKTDATINGTRVSFRPTDGALGEKTRLQKTTSVSENNEPTPKKEKTISQGGLIIDPRNPDDLEMFMKLFGMGR